MHKYKAKHTHTHTHTNIKQSLKELIPSVSLLLKKEEGNCVCVCEWNWQGHSGFVNHYIKILKKLKKKKEKEKEDLTREKKNLN